MGYYQEAKAGRITPAAAKKDLLEKARKNNEEAYARKSSTWRKLEKMEVQNANT